MADPVPRLPPSPTVAAVQDHSEYQDHLGAAISTSSMKPGLQPRQIEYQSDLNSVCGYISGFVSTNSTWTSTWTTVSCENAYCGFNYAFQAVGCCASYQSASLSQVVQNSCSYNIACIAASQLTDCDERCQADDMILKCTEGSATFCNTFIYTDLSYTSLACGTSVEFPIVHLSTVTITPTFALDPYVSTTYTAGIFASETVGPSTMTNAFPQVIQASNEFGGHVGRIATAVFGGLLGLFFITALTMFLCLRKRSREYGAARTNREYDYGQPLMRVRSEQPVVERSHQVKPVPEVNSTSAHGMADVWSS